MLRMFPTRPRRGPALCAASAHVCGDSPAPTHPFQLQVTPTHMPGPDQRILRTNRRPRRRTGGNPGRAPVSEFDEMQEVEAARERNDLEVGDLREMSVAELRQVGREMQLDTQPEERKDDLVDQ